MMNIDKPAFRHQLDVVQKQIRTHWPEDGVQSARLFHGRGQCFPGLEFLTVDWFNPVVVMTTFAPVDPESEDFLQLVSTVSSVVTRLVDKEPVVVWQNRAVRVAETRVLEGRLPEVVYARYRHLQFELDFQQAQNLGYFLDMDAGREWLAERAKGKNILNTFAYTCVFSVVAMAAGASQVVNIDLSRRSLERGRKNHQINRLAVDNVHFFDHNIFRSWKKLHKYGRYDIVILDPPTFQKGSFDAKKDYRKIVRRLSRLLKPGGEILACLNSPFLGVEFLQEVFAQELPGAVFQERLPVSENFPEVDHERNLKVLSYRYQPAEPGGFTE